MGSYANFMSMLSVSGSGKKKKPPPHVSATSLAADLLAATKSSLTGEVMNEEVVKVVGRVQPTAPEGLVRAPLSGKMCVYYEVSVSQGLQEDSVLNTVAESADFFVKTGDDDGKSLTSAVFVQTHEFGVAGCAFKADRTLRVDLSADQHLSDLARSFCDKYCVDRGGSNLEKESSQTKDEEKDEDPENNFPPMRVEAIESVVLAGDALAAFGYLRNAALVPAEKVTPKGAARLKWSHKEKKMWASVNSKLPRRIFLTTSYLYINHPNYSTSIDQRKKIDSEKRNGGRKTKERPDDHLPIPPQGDVHARWFFTTFLQAKEPQLGGAIVLRTTHASTSKFIDEDGEEDSP